MKSNCITKADLKKKSEELQIPFSNLLAAYVMEEMMYHLAESDFVKDLWLKTDGIFDSAHYRENQFFHLDFVYHLEEKILRTEKIVSGQRLSEPLIEMILSSIFVKEKSSGIRWKYSYQWKEDEVSVEVTAEFEEMKVPVEIQIEVLKVKGILPEKKEFEPLFREVKKITYQHYPMESILVEGLIELVEYMELIPSMKSYYMIYNIISKEPIDGRHVQEAVEELCKEKKIACTLSRGEMLSDYQEYPYMRKRWEKFAKTLKKNRNDKNEEIPEWKDLSKVVFRFFLPIWNSTIRDEIFIGDWMPELGRYLD